MPSLRRTLSSPSVRASPYSHSSLLTRQLTAQGGHGPRRSSGSETGQRRVLADIDWWRVEQSQREVRGLPPLAQTLHVPPDAPGSNNDNDNDLESPRSFRVMIDVPLWQPAPGSGGAMHDSELLYPFSSDLNMNFERPVAVDTPESIAPQFAALSISSRAETHRRLVSSSASSVSSVSSLESTPSRSPFASLGFGDIVPQPHIPDDDDDDAFTFGTPSLPRSLVSRRVPGAPQALGRSVSYSYVEDQLSLSGARNDSSPLELEDSFHDAFNDQNDDFFAQTRADVDDLFN